MEKFHSVIFHMYLLSYKSKQIIYSKYNWPKSIITVGEKMTVNKN